MVWLRFLHHGACISHPRWIPAWGFLEGWQDISSPPSSFWPFLNSSELVLKDILWAGMSLLSVPPEFSWLLFSCSTVSFIGTSSCETTQATGYHCAWPRREVLVSSSLTLLYRIELRKTGMVLRVNKQFPAHFSCLPLFCSSLLCCLPFRPGS